MALPLSPPIKPQLALTRKALPTGEEWAYEPKLDGFRAIVFVDGLNCRPCLASATALGTVARTAPHLTAVMVDVNASDGKAEVAELLAKTRWGRRAIVLDTPANDVASRFDVETIGTVLVYRPDGTITDVLVDPSRATLRRSLQPAAGA